MQIHYTFDYILKEQTEGYTKTKEVLLRVKWGGNRMEEIGVEAGFLFCIFDFRTI